MTVDECLKLGWRGAALAIAVLALRRLPAVLLLRPWIPQLRQRRDAVFVGWFGPIGVSAMFYAMLALRRTGDETVWGAASLLIFASIVAHGITATR
jgi:NhaP-type Na+/H+ or K+/H+ antiporter